MPPVFLAWMRKLSPAGLGKDTCPATRWERESASIGAFLRVSCSTGWQPKPTERRPHDHTHFDLCCQRCRLLDSHQCACKGDHPNAGATLPTRFPEHLEAQEPTRRLGIPLLRRGRRPPCLQEKDCRNGDRISQTEGRGEGNRSTQDQRQRRSGLCSHKHGTARSTLPTRRASPDRKSVV